MKKRQRREPGLFSDMLRKVQFSGDLLPRADIRKIVVSNIENLRDNALDVFASEVSKMLNRMDAQKILHAVLAGYTIKLEARINLEPKDKKVRLKGANIK